MVIKNCHTDIALQTFRISGNLKKKKGNNLRPPGNLRIHTIKNPWMHALEVQMSEDRFMHMRMHKVAC